MCDTCLHALGGEICVAVTDWNERQAPEPKDWEDDYGVRLPDSVVKAADKLGAP